MIGLVLVSHGGLARALLETATEIVGPYSSTAVVEIARHESLEEISTRVRAAIAGVSGPDGTLVLVDAFGGTASNVALELVEELPIEVVAGVNLPMLLRLKGAVASARELRTLAQTIKHYGQRHIVVASDILSSLGES